MEVLGYRWCVCVCVCDEQSVSVVILHAHIAPSVQYRLSEDPKLLTTGKVPSQGDTRISLAPDSRVVAVAVNSSIFVYSTASGDLLETLDSVHKGETSLNNNQAAV